MARGFESKDVEFQQAEAMRARQRGRASDSAKATAGKLTAEERETQGRRRTLELALARTRAERDAARSDVHRSMLDNAVAALESELQRLK
jgi:F0F1-type ATP synthase membrane subunit b/b'